MSRKYVFAVLGGLLIGLSLAPAVVSGQEGRSAQQDKDRRVATRAAVEQPAPVPRAFDSAASVYIPRATQCVLFDTRPTLGGSGAITGGSTRTFALTGSLGAQGGEPGCSVPAGADGYHLNLVAIDPVGGGNFKAWPASAAEPNGGIVNYSSGSTMNNSNAFHIPNDAGGVKVKSNGATSHARGILYGTLEDGGNFYADEALVSSDKWAKVDADAAGATLLHGSGATSVARIGTGVFSVTFDSSVVGCGWQATLNNNLDGVVSPGEVGIELGSSFDPTTLWVRTWDSAGSPTDPSATDGFTVDVDC